LLLVIAGLDPAIRPFALKRWTHRNSGLPEFRIMVRASGRPDVRVKPGVTKVRKQKGRGLHRALFYLFGEEA
jgi:hypothetical protein